MNWLIRFSLKNRLAVLFMAILLSVVGVYAATQLKMEAMPDVSFPIVVAMTPYPGASPEDIDREVTQPLEKVFRNGKGVTKTNSVSADGSSVVIVRYDLDTDMEKAQQEMKEAMRQVKLPQQALETRFSRYDFNSFPVISLSLSSKTKSLTELEQWAKNTVKDSLRSIEGIGEVEVKGQGPKAVYVLLRPDSLKKYRLSAQQVQQAMQGANLSLPAGNLQIQSTDLPVRVSQKITNIDQLKNLTLTVPLNPAAGMETASKQIGEGFQGLGTAIGGLNQGLVQTSKLIQAMQDVQAQIIGTQLQINYLLIQKQSVMTDPLATAKINQQIAQLQQQIGMQQGMLQQMNSQWKKSLSAQGGNIPMPPRAKATNSGTQTKTVKLSEVASVIQSGRDSPLITRTNGQLSVDVDIYKNPEANTVDVAEKVQQKVSRLAKNNPDVAFTPLFDQSKSIKTSIRSMVREGSLGALFAGVIIFAFLRKFRMTFISLISIPLSILITLAILKQAGVTLNIMTLGGLAVAVGRIVDDSIVVIENIYRRLSRPDTAGENVIDLATREVSAAITSSTLTTVAVFIPLGFVNGIIGKIFFPFALTVAVSLLTSLLIAVTVVPVMAKGLLLKGKPIRVQRGRSQLVSWYQRALAWSLDHKKRVLTIASLLLFGSLLLIPLVGTSFIPSDKDKAVRVSIKMPPGTELTKTNQLTEKVERKLAAHREVKLISSTVGSLPGKLTNEGTIGSARRAMIFVSLRPNVDMDEFLPQLRTEMKTYAKEAEVQISDVHSVGPPSNTIQLGIQGGSMAEIKKTANLLTEKMKHVAGLTNVINNVSEQKELITVYVDDAKAAQHQLVAGQVAATIRGLLSAEKVLDMGADSSKQEVKLGLEGSVMTNVQDLEQVQILSPLGNMVELKSIATIRKEKGPVTVQKENGQLYASISGSVVDKDTGAVARKILEQAKKTALPSDIQVKLTGDTEEMNKSFSQLGLAMLVAVVMVYIVMMIAFGEATAPFAILFSLPFAVIGGLFGLWLTDQAISVSSMIGALMLIGIVVTNAIVLMDRVIHQRQKGLSVREALLEAGSTRLRPILMTALATVFALLPLALGYGEGTLISQGLAVVVIGGLASSTFLTLFVVPIVYSLISQLGRKQTG